MARVTKDREINVQKPAQSLAHFQTKLGQPETADEGLLKPILIGVIAVLALGLLYAAYAAYGHARTEKFEAAFSGLQIEVEGDGLTPPAPAEVEQRMRERLGRLEALVADAPASRRAPAAGLLANWRLMLDGKETTPAPAGEPWSHLRLAQRALALGQVPAARALLDPLRAKAQPGEPWAEAFWASQLDTDRLAGDRTQALKDLTEYKARFKGRGDAAALESLVKSI